MTTGCATVLVGTLYPLALEALTGEKISVGAPFFNLTFVPLFIPLFILMPIGQSLAWKRGDLLAAAQRLTFAIGCGLIVALALAAWRGGPVLSVILSGLAAYVIIGSFADVARRLFAGGASFAAAGRRLFGLPRQAFGSAFAHAGIGVTLLGLAATGWGAERITSMRPGETVEIGPYQLTLEDVSKRQGPNYAEIFGRTTIRSGGVVKAAIEPAMRAYPSRKTSRSEAGIATLGFGQVYMSIAEVAPDGKLDARIYWKPLVALIWLGALDHGVWRRAVAERHASSRRRRTARPQDRRGQPFAGGVMMNYRLVRRCMVVAAFWLVPLAAGAVQPDEILADPKLEARARDLSAQLRCMVCQNQSIDDSNAELARDLRLLVRERLKAGDSDDAIRTYLVQRYGDFILLRPPVKAETLALWGAPIVILLVGGGAIFLNSRRRRAAVLEPQGLSDREAVELKTLLDRDSPSS